jgi:uncharacterized delta-60 repeat protein
MSHKRTAVLAMWCSLGLLGASSAQAAPGDLDPTFSGDGLQFTDFGPGPSSAGAVARQSDGKIVTVGGSAGGFALARYNPDGSLDTTFSDDGKQTTSFGDFDFVGRANGVALQPDGKIVVVGDSGGPGFALARYNPDGSLDTTFSEDGKQTTGFEDGFATDVVVQPDGKIVAVGATEFFPAGDFALARYNPDGSLDTTFSEDGKQTTDFGGGAEPEVARGVVLQPDGRIVVAGGTSGGDFGLSRYNADGSLDTTFSGDGKQTTRFGESIDQAQDLALQTDGRIVVAGGTGNGDFGLARYTADGSLDTTFSGDGKQTTDFADPGADSRPFDSIGGVALQEDGKVIAAGASRPFAFGPVDARFALARYNPDGSLDTTFSEDGKQITSFGDGAASALALRADGKIVAVGSGGPRGSGNFALARYNLDGSLDTTFSEDGKQTTEFAGFDAAEAVALQPDGKIVAVGGVGEFALARYNTDGSLDTSFSEDGKQTTAFGGTGAFGSSAGARGVALQSDGKIIVVGGDASGDFALARYNADGSLDTSLSDDGLQTTEFDGFDSAASVVLQPDGKIVAAGRTNDDFAVARYNSDGTLDTAFSDDGLQVTSFGGASRFDAGAQGVALQPDGKIVVAGGGSGAVDDDFALVRYNPDGSLDTTFSDDGKQTTDFSGADSARGVAMQSDGRIVVVGDSSAGEDFALARYNPDGSLDTTFLRRRQADHRLRGRRVRQRRHAAVRRQNSRRRQQQWARRRFRVGALQHRRVARHQLLRGRQADHRPRRRRLRQRRRAAARRHGRRGRKWAWRGFARLCPRTLRGRERTACRHHAAADVDHRGTGRWLYVVGSHPNVRVHLQRAGIDVSVPGRWRRRVRVRVTLHDECAGRRPAHLLGRGD